MKICNLFFALVASLRPGFSKKTFVSNWSKCFLPPTRARSIIDSDNCTKEDKVAGARNWSDGTFAIAGKTIDKVQFLLRELGNNEGWGRVDYAIHESVIYYMQFMSRTEIYLASSFSKVCQIFAETVYFTTSQEAESQGVISEMLWAIL